MQQKMKGQTHSKCTRTDSLKQCTSSQNVPQHESPANIISSVYRQNVHSSTPPPSNKDDQSRFRDAVTPREIDQTKGSDDSETMLTSAYNSSDADSMLSSSGSASFNIDGKSLNTNDLIDVLERRPVIDALNVSRETFYPLTIEIPVDGSGSFEPGTPASFSYLGESESEFSYDSTNSSMSWSET
jgi:hypothetical protein